jgi:hypothetical protein
MKIFLLLPLLVVLAACKKGETVNQDTNRNGDEQKSVPGPMVSNSQAPGPTGAAPSGGKTTTDPAGSSDPTNVVPAAAANAPAPGNQR